MGEFRMPSLGADMDAGTLVGWRVKPGDPVKRGDIVADVETQKGVIEVEIWEDGTIDQLLVGVDQKVPVGTVLATLRRPGEVPAPVTPPAHRPRISPAARKRAEVLGVAPETLTGSGPGGAITSEDVERAAARKPQTPGEAMRSAIAGAMAKSNREIPHYFLERRIELEGALGWLEAENARRPVEERLLHVALLLKAVALALRKAPELNGHFVDGAFRPSSEVNLGVAIALRGGGLIAPAIRDATQLSLTDLMRALTDLINRVRSGGLRSSELEGPTITVTNLAEPGVDAVYGVIYPPQVALVGFGRVQPVPIAVEGQVVVRPAVSVTLAADHRVSDGHRGARFLAELDALLQKPEAL